MNKAVVSDIQLEEVTPEELKQLAAMHLEIWQQAHQAVFSQKELEDLQLKEFEKAWEQRTADGGREIRWVRLGGKKLGFLSFTDKGQGAAEITHFHLLPAYWGSGLATVAMRAFLLLLLAEGMKNISLWVLSDNLRAQRFCKAWRFERHSRQRTHYQFGLKLQEELRVFGLKSV